MTEKNNTVLIVDDSSDDLKILLENLKQDYAVLAATSGKKALEFAAKEPRPDVILLDVMMPEMDGYETCRQLKANPDTKNIDVIFVSAHDTTEEILAGYESGGSDYLIKPVQPLELMQKVKLAISNKDIRDASEEQQDMAIKTAMIAMTSAGEQGVVLEFLRHSFSANTIEMLGQMIVDSISSYGLENSVQLRTSQTCFNTGIIHPVPPLEEELLTRLKDQDRIMEYGKRAIFNFGGVSLLVKNMPDDDDKRGRLRDHIAILLEGAESKLNALEVSEQLAQVVIDSNQALKRVEEAQKQHKESNVTIMNDMMRELEASFLSWGLSEDQEQSLIDVVQSGIGKAAENFDEGLKIDEQMRQIVDRLIEVSNE